MIEQTEETVTQTRVVYTAPAADTSVMTAVMEDGLATFTVGGTQAIVPAESLPGYAALVAAVAAAIVPAPETAPAPEVEPEGDPE